MASLKHPHVATVHGLEESEDGTRFLVMWLLGVRYLSLSYRIRRRR